jgi:hypothetical protein
MMLKDDDDKYIQVYYYYIKLLLIYYIITSLFKIRVKRVKNENYKRDMKETERVTK